MFCSKFLQIILISFFINGYGVRGALLLPSVYGSLPIAHKLVCFSSSSVINSSPSDLVCVNDAKIKIHYAISGMQSQQVCPQMETNVNEGDMNVQLSSSCNEVVETTRIVKDKCNGFSNCSLFESVRLDDLPHNCDNDLYSYVNITYSCVTTRLPCKLNFKFYLIEIVFKFFVFQRYSVR
jgi:hypothetical protein